MVDQPLQIVCATDRFYLEMTGVLIASITSQSHQRPVSIFLICSGLRATDKSRLLRCVNGTARLQFIDIDDQKAQILSNLPVKRHLTVTAYARLLIPDMLPELDGRILYMDCDVVVNAPLDELFLVDLAGKVVGAAQNQATSERLEELNKSLNRPFSAPYFNSGVLLIDLVEWRRQEIGRRAIASAVTWSNDRGDHDQAVLNLVLDDKWQEIHPKWNSNPMRVSPVEAARMPVQHFWGKRKPFFTDYPKAYRQTYDRYRVITPWAKAPRLSKTRRRLMSKVGTWKKIIQRNARAVSVHFLCK